MTHDLALPGCRPDPLGHYLKALAVLRLVGAQADANAKGYWRDDVFHLVSALDEAALLQFFAEEYKPTPIVGPWGARSGFFDGSSESSAREALRRIETSTSPRFAAFRECVAAVRMCMKARGVTAKATDDEKTALLAALRNLLPDEAIPWLDAAYVLGTAVGERGFPIILGTGGNEGSQGFSSTFMSALDDLGLLCGHTDAAGLRAALFGGPALVAVTSSTAQFNPGGTPGYNQAAGFSGGPSASGWDMVLAFEGASTWVSGASKRHGATSPSRLSSPFSVRSRAVGFNAAGGEETSARGEIWLPLWSRPASATEIAALLGESRAQAGQRGAATATDMAKAAGALGTDRGIDAFERQALLVRNGKSYFAVSAGRFAVYERSTSDQIRELEPLLDALDQRIRQLGDNVPARLQAHRRDVEEALFVALRAPDPARMAMLLRRLGRMAAVLATMDGGRKVLSRPLGGLSMRWLLEATDCLELRVAAALNSIGSSGEIGGFLSNVIPVDPAKSHSYVVGAGQTAWQGSSVVARLASVLRRRLLDFTRLSCEELPLTARIRLAPEDAVAILDGRVDEPLLDDLIFAFGCIDWRKQDALGEVLRRWARPISAVPIPPAYALLKAVLIPGCAFHEIRVVPLLMANRIDAAVALATARLRMADMDPVRLSPVIGTPSSPVANPSLDGVRLAAALLVPIRDPESLSFRVVRHRMTERTNA